MNFKENNIIWIKNWLISLQKAKAANHEHNFTPSHSVFGLLLSNKLINLAEFYSNQRLNIQNKVFGMRKYGFVHSKEYRLKKTRITELNFTPFLLHSPNNMTYTKLEMICVFVFIPRGKGSFPHHIIFLHNYFFMACLAIKPQVMFCAGDFK